MKVDGGWDFYTSNRPTARKENCDEHAQLAPSAIHMKLFDDKIPTYDEFRYNGNKGGDRWRLKVRGYWLSKCPQLLPVLTFVERSEVPIARALLEHFVSPDSGAMCDISMKELTTLSALVYGFLNTATYGDADDIMLRVAELEGFEAWRVLCRHIDSGRTIRLDALRRRMRRPAPIRSLADVPQEFSSSRI